MSAVTNQSIDNRIDTVSYYRLPGTTVTICQIKMVNGFTVLGESACVNPADFDQEKGEQYAHENAREKLWPLEGYLAAERRYQERFARCRRHPGSDTTHIRRARADEHTESRDRSRRPAFHANG